MARGLAIVWVGVAACGGIPAIDAGPPDARIVDAAPPADAHPIECVMLPGAQPMLISQANSAEEDRDPTLIRARDGSLVVAYASRRLENDDLYVTLTIDGPTWMLPERVTTSPDEDRAPHLIQARDGEFHIVWSRRGAGFTGSSHIRYTTTRDLTLWNEADERAITTGASAVDDADPTIAETPDGRLVVLFTSASRAGNGQRDVYAISSSDGGETWSAPSSVPGVNDPVEHDAQPHVAYTWDELSLVWIRHDGTTATPGTNPTADLFFVESVDGVTWDEPFNITNDDTDGYYDVTPSLYRRHPDGARFIVWVTNRDAPVSMVREIGVMAHEAYPNYASMVLEGLSPQVVSLPGCRFGVWVFGTSGYEEIFGRYF